MKSDQLHITRCMRFASLTQVLGFASHFACTKNVIILKLIGRLFCVIFKPEDLP